MSHNVYNIPLSEPFGAKLSSIIIKEIAKEDLLALSKIKIILPSRRSCRNLENEFIKIFKGKATILPQIIPILDINDDFNESFFITKYELENLPQIESVERVLLLSKIIMAKTDILWEKLKEEQAISLAFDLINLIDKTEEKELNFNKLKDLVPREYASHWEESLKFLQIITDNWPQILKSIEKVNPKTKKIRQIENYREYLNKEGLKTPLIAAGFTHGTPSLNRLLKTLIKQDKGYIYFFGIDKHLSSKDWEKIDESHPNFGIKNMLKDLELQREDIKDISSASEKDIFISEILRPSQTTNLWKEQANIKLNKEIIENITLLEAPTPQIESLSIALLMRECLETEGKTCSLVTIDRNLARRVSAELKRWDISVDDSSGIPLYYTSLGIFLRLTAEVIINDFSAETFLALLKHPLTNGKMEKGELKRAIGDLELKIREKGAYNEGIKSLYLITKNKTYLEDFIRYIDEISQDMQNIKGQGSSSSLKIILKAHLNFAEQLSATSSESGNKLLWRGESGSKASDLISEILEYADILESLSLSGYLRILESFMSKIALRPLFGTHPRLSILGQLESRLSNADMLILGGLNEGVFPPTLKSSPWLSRNMMQDFGLGLPEETIGIAAYDFAETIAKKEVYLTRSIKEGGAPSISSRFLLRLETFLEQEDLKEKWNENKQRGKQYIKLAEYLLTPEKYEFLSEPNPKPPLTARPKEFSVTQIEKLMRDPYSIYAQKILKLEKLEEINQEKGAAEYGNIIHTILEQFSNDYPLIMPENSYEILIEKGQAAFKDIDFVSKAFWFPRFEKAMRWFVETETKHRKEIEKGHFELKGKIKINTASSEFELKCKADRIDISSEGLYLIDYKTGIIPTQKEVLKGFSPQLSLEAAIALKGGFQGITNPKIKQLSYWQINGKDIGGKEVIIAPNKDISSEDLAKEALEGLKALLEAYMNPVMGYLHNPVPYYAPKYSDYEHLARSKAWQED